MREGIALFRRPTSSMREGGFMLSHAVDVEGARNSPHPREEPSSLSRPAARHRSMIMTTF